MIDADDIDHGQVKVLWVVISRKIYVDDVVCFDYILFGNFVEWIVHGLVFG